MNKLIVPTEPDEPLIHAILRKTDGAETEKDFKSWISCAAWMEKHYGEYEEIHAEQVKSAESDKCGRV